MAALDTVLAKIDANLDSALGRLFKLVEIPSISTDPAYAGACVKAAECADQSSNKCGILTPYKVNKVGS